MNKMCKGGHCLLHALTLSFKIQCLSHWQNRQTVRRLSKDGAAVLGFQLGRQLAHSHGSTSLQRKIPLEALHSIQQHFQAAYARHVAIVCSKAWIWQIHNICHSISYIRCMSDSRLFGVLLGRCKRVKEGLPKNPQCRTVFPSKSLCTVRRSVFLQEPLGSVERRIRRQILTRRIRMRWDKGLASKNRRA